MLLNLNSYPAQFAPQKPQQQVTPEALSALLIKGAYVTKKYNGNRVHVLKGDRSVRIFSRNGKLEWTACLPLLVAELEALDIPPHSFLDAEVYVPAVDGRIESTIVLQSIVNSGDATLGARFEASLLPRLAVFDMLVRQGVTIYTLPLQARLAYLSALALSSRVHRAEEVVISGYEQALALVKAAGWEGLVAADLAAPHKVNLNGNTKRGESFKLKARFDEEFLVIASELSVIASMGVGTLTVVNRAGQQFKVGSFSLDCDRRSMAAQTGYLVEICHFGYDEETGGLNFPKVLRVRDDVTVEEWRAADLATA